MSSENNLKNDNWNSRRIYLTALLAQTLGINTLLFLPHKAVNDGAVGHIIVYTITYILIGIPLLYMECIIGQFTGRDCLEVWHIRPCLSHVGYVHVFWQLLIAIYLHTANSFIVHYFLISFENPIPYYMCGRWSKRDCDILNYNYSVNLDCLKLRDPLPYCKDLCKTFPEYQYWRFNILGLDKDYFFLPMRVSLATGLISIFVYLSCFKGIRSLKWLLLVVTIYPVCGRFLFTIGSMLQKGLVVKYEESLDVNFSLFPTEFSLSAVISEVIYSLCIGSGLGISCSSRASFRAPCYSNTVIVVVITCAVVILSIASSAMMTCPYAFKYDISPNSIMQLPITHIFEKIPRLLHVYESTSMWLILSFSFIAVSGTSVSISIMSSLLEILAKRNPKLANNLGLVSFVISIALFCFTVPLLGNFSLYILVDIKRIANVIAIFMTLLENIVFVLWYGVEKFSEDVHFMQGVPPRLTMKACWLISAVLLFYVFITQSTSIFTDKNKTLGMTMGCWLTLVNVLVTILVTVVRILIALYQKRVHDVIRLDPTWGPKSDLLKRSRAMFTAQAMTKEYMYRQYHLQAGILMRQKRSNVRMCYKEGYISRLDV